MENDIHIDLSQIPKYQMDSICKAILESCKKFDADPKNVEAYEKWKTERDAKKSKTATVAEKWSDFPFAKLRVNLKPSIFNKVSNTVS